MNQLISKSMLRLDQCDKQAIKQYFINAWDLEETLFKSIAKEETFYQQADRLRNPIIFYLGHSAVFYINKLLSANLLEKGINPEYEILFEIGVDPKIPEDLDAVIKDLEWGEVSDIWAYRGQVYETILAVIDKTDLNLPIHEKHPLWALIMGIEHSRIHFETSSVLFRQLPVSTLNTPKDWKYAPSNGAIEKNPMIEIKGNQVEWGKSKDFPVFGWDMEYGHRKATVQTFLASKYLITNGEFLEFVKEGAYENQSLWEEEAWEWKTRNQVTKPKFWVKTAEGYQYRAMFDIIDLPLDFPVEVNYHEATAYCKWKGTGFRLMREEEWNLTLQANNQDSEAEAYESDLNLSHEYNINLQWGSPTPVNFYEASNQSKLCDLRGNVWQWLKDDFNPLPGFETHPLYEDQSAPFFDDEHKIILGGSWASNGSMASKFYRNWFRPDFYQHAGFRLTKDIGVN